MTESQCVFDFSPKNIPLIMFLTLQTNLISMDALQKVVDPNQLTPDLEGTLQYDHATWIDLRCVSADMIFEFANKCS